MDRVGDTMESNAALRRCQPPDALDYGAAFCIPLLIIAGFCTVNTQLVHWFLAPLFACGVLVSVDAVRWLRARMDTYDPKGLIGLVGVHFFLVAPLLVAHYDPERVNDVYVSDWKFWLGAMGGLNAAGLIGYQLVQRWAARGPARSGKRRWMLNADTASVVILVVLVLAIGAHAIYLSRLGGLSGYVARRTHGESQVGAETRGLGPLMALGRSIPILVVILLTTWRYRRLQRSSNLIMVNTLMILAIAAQVFVAGLTGSRGATVWLLFWTVGIAHFFWRRIPVAWVVIGMVPLLAFMYVYSFYKNVGSRVLELAEGTTARVSLESETRRTFTGMLVGDLSRADIQAGALKVLYDGPWSYRLRYGATYPTAIVPLIPRALMPEKSESGKVIAGTEMFTGPGSYAELGRILYFGGGRRMTSVYGLAGEAMLNFGALGVVPAFAIFGFITGRARRRILSYSVGDARLLTAPFVSMALLLLLTHDLDNLAQQALFNWVVPATILFFVSTKLPQRAAAPWPAVPGVVPSSA